MNVTILGCGYIGTAVARCWQSQPDRQYTLTVTTTTPERLSELAEIADRTLVVESQNLDALKTALTDQQVVLVTVGAKNRSNYETAYLKTAQNLLQVLPATVRQIIYTGSYAVYGDQQGKWVDEETPIAPVNENSEILAATERVFLSAISERLQVCLFRVGGIYGSGRELIKIFGRTAGTTRPGDGSDASNWVHQDDIVGAIDFAVQHQLSGIYNLVQTHPVTTGELFARLMAQHHLPPITWDPSQPSPRPYNARVSNQKLRSAGYVFQHPELEYS
ncbi:MAG: NAD-dependent epimerase/dehydratase family protein [Elainella sp. Prado103]|jgi:nucleoside-diphosphate-sugar epimerase|nr:NAD-dependent epimerase/dehydratase family protein [Elainella sp. Prado103]